jgi:hypothetical protein
VLAKGAPWLGEDNDREGDGKDGFHCIVFHGDASVTGGEVSAAFWVQGE